MDLEVQAYQEYQDLAAERQKLIELWSEKTLQRALTIHDELKREQALDVVHTRMYVLAKEAVYGDYNHESNLLLKTVLLAEFVEERTDDIVHQLAMAVCNEVFNSSRAERWRRRMSPPVTA